MVDSQSVFSDEQRESLSRAEPTPLYHQLYEQLKDAILDGRLARGMKLPSEHQLSDDFGVSRITSRRALAELAKDGLVTRQPGRGTHVIHRMARRPIHSPMIGTLQEIESIGRTSTAKVVKCAMRQPPREVRTALELPDNGKALYLERIRVSDDLPFGYYRSWTLGVKAPENLEVLVKTPRLSYFREQGFRPNFIRQQLNAVSASKRVAEVLSLDVGSPILSLTRVAFTGSLKTRKPVDYLRVLYHPGLFEYRIELDLEQPT